MIFLFTEKRKRMLLTKSKIFEKRLFKFTFYNSDFYVHGNMKKIFHKILNNEKSYLINLYSYLGNSKYLNLFPKPGVDVLKGIIENNHISLIEYYVMCSPKVTPSNRKERLFLGKFLYKSTGHEKLDKYLRKYMRSWNVWYYL